MFYELQFKYVLPYSFVEVSVYFELVRISITVQHILLKRSNLKSEKAGMTLYRKGSDQVFKPLGTVQ